MDNFEQIKMFDLNRYQFDWILMGLTALSNAFQFFTIWMILSKSPKDMHEYRFYLFGVTFSDLIFNFTIGFIITPKLWMPDSLGCHAIGLAIFMGPNGGRFAYGMGAFALCSQLLFQMFSTVYRMATVLSTEYPKLLAQITRRRTRIWMCLICAIISGTVAYISFITTITRERAFEWHFDGFNKQIPMFNNLSISQFKCCLNLSKEMDILLNEPTMLEIFDRFETTEYTMVDVIRGRVEYSIRANKNYTNEMAHILNAVREGYPLIYFDFLKDSFKFLCLFYFGFLLIGQSVCVISSAKIIRYLRNHQRNFSTQTYQLQMQLIILLIIQILQPILLLLFPIIFVLLTLIELNIRTYQNIHEGRNSAGNIIFVNFSRLFAEAVLLLLIAYSIMNSLLINTFVGPYRREICKLLKFLIWRRQSRNNLIHPLSTL